MKVILVPVADRPECRTALKQAFQLGHTLSSNIVGCHLRTHRSEEPAGGRRRRRLEQRSADLPTTSLRESNLKHKAAEKLFLKHVAEHGFDLVKRPRLNGERCARWFEMVGSRDRLFSIAGPVADMSIVSRPTQTARGLGPEFLLAAIHHSGKPVLVLPQKRKRPVGRRILVAWDQSVDAARAATAALPLLQQAEAVHIVSCGRENRPGPKASDLARYFTFWNVKSERHVTKGQNAAKEIEGIYGDEGCDLIVMGAYSRSRMREIVFGGVTQHMLFKTRKPVFAYHT